MHHLTTDKLTRPFDLLRIPMYFWGVWIGPRAILGHGEGSSGLACDQVEESTMPA